MTAAYTANGSGARHGSRIIAVFHNTGSPVLSGHTADIANGTGDISLVVTTADRAVTVDGSDNTANIGPAGDSCLIAAVRDLSGSQLSDDAGDIGSTVHLAADNQIFNRSAVHVPEKTDRRSGRDIQSADHMIVSVKCSLERIG
ncbi:unknown [Clostridium sp. CAG:448]|nr:unknown [Clostridium sp. CAG:448]